MTTAGELVDDPRLTAPSADGQVKIHPPPAELVERLESREDPPWSNYDCQGRSLASLAAAARSDLLAAAVAYTSSYLDVGDLSRIDSQQPIILAGHQPSLFHPGVWAKNVFIGRLANRVGGTAVNLLIDSDLCRSATVRVPGGNPAQPVVQHVPLDRYVPERPFEQRAIVEGDIFEQFGQQAGNTISRLVPDPLLDSFWPRVVERFRDLSRQAGGVSPRSRSRKTVANNVLPNLGACLAQARHQLEHSWGLRTLELPQSQVCRLPVFFWFLAHTLAHLPRLSDIYNSAVHAYRRRHRIRNRAHPVPDLACDGSWLEAPYWIWSDQDPRRRRLFVRLQQGRIRLADGAGWEQELSLSPERDAADAVDQLTALAAGGLKIRTRALMTTMFARLLLGDLFVHGIGGARYDRLTDSITQEFFGLRLPPFATISGTLRLPVDRPRVAADALRAARGQLRQLEYHPERWISPAEDPRQRAAQQQWSAHKQEWVATVKSRANARRRHQEIARSNAELQKWLTDQQRQLRTRIEQLGEALRRQAIIDWREYAFCLYPDEKLRIFLLDTVQGRL